MITDVPNKRAWRLFWYAIMYPHYHLLIADDSHYPGTNWTWTFDIIVNHEHKTITFKGECT